MEVLLLYQKREEENNTVKLGNKDQTLSNRTKHDRKPEMFKCKAIPLKTDKWLTTATSEDLLPLRKNT